MYILLYEQQNTIVTWSQAGIIFHFTQESLTYKVAQAVVFILAAFESTHLERMQKELRQVGGVQDTGT